MPCCSCGAVHFMLGMQNEHDINGSSKLGVWPALHKAIQDNCYTVQASFSIQMIIVNDTCTAFAPQCTLSKYTDLVFQLGLRIEQRHNHARMSSCMFTDHSKSSSLPSRNNMSQKLLTRAHARCKAVGGLTITSTLRHLRIVGLVGSIQHVQEVLTVAQALVGWGSIAPTCSVVCQSCNGRDLACITSISCVTLPHIDTAPNSRPAMHVM